MRAKTVNPICKFYGFGCNKSIEILAVQLKIAKVFQKVFFVTFGKIGAI